IGPCCWHYPECNATSVPAVTAISSVASIASFALVIARPAIPSFSAIAPASSFRDQGNIPSVYIYFLYRPVIGNEIVYCQNKERSCIGLNKIYLHIEGVAFFTMLT